LSDLTGHNGVVKSLDFHPTETLICSFDSFDVIEVWDVINYIRMKNFMVTNYHSYED
jgi:WD40 repeat protein